MNIQRFDFYTAPELCAVVGSRLRQQRLLQQLRQDDVAQRAGVGISTVQRFEQGKGGSLENFLRLVMALGLVRELEGLLLPPQNTLNDLAKIQAVSHRQRSSGKRR